MSDRTLLKAASVMSKKLVLDFSSLIIRFSNDQYLETQTVLIF